MTEPFHLIETMRLEGDVALLDRHVGRLERSALFFGFPVDVERVRSSVLELRSRLAPSDFSFRVRLGLDHDGRLEIAVRRLAEPPAAPRMVRMSEKRIQAGDVFRRHKTSNRRLYDTEYRAARAEGLFEVLYLNEDGYVAEGSRSNIFVHTSGESITPPVEDGALPGVRRAVELDSGPAAVERRLTESDLKSADRLFVCNAVIGMVEVQLIDSDPTRKR